MKPIPMYPRLISIFCHLDNSFSTFTSTIFSTVVMESFVTTVSFSKDGILSCMKSFLFFKLWKSLPSDIILASDMANDVSKCELSSNVVCCMCSTGRVIIFDCHTILSVTVVLWSTIVVFVEDGSSLREQEHDSNKKNSNIENGLFMCVLLLKTLNHIINLKFIYSSHQSTHMKYISISYKKHLSCCFHCLLN